MTTSTEPEVVTLARQMRAKLISLDAATASEMIDAYGKVWLRVKAEVDGLLLEAAHNKLTAEKVQRLGQMRKVTRMISDELDHFAGIAGTRITEAQAQAVNLARENTRRMIDAALPPGIDTALLEGTAVQWTALHREAFSMFVGMAGDGGPLARLLDAIGPNVAAGVREAIASGIAQGWSPRFTAIAVRQKVGMGLTRALTISRTETLRSYREANRLQYAANSHLVKGFRRVSARDDRVCMACAVLDGEVYETSELGYFHVNCLLPGTVIRGPSVLGGSRAFYRGQAVEITTEDGHRLAVTPNHMILTPAGFVRAKALREGNYVIGGGLSQRVVASGPDNYNRPAAIEEIWHSLVMQPGVSGGQVPVAPVDFHGDARAIYGKVHVVWPKGPLGSYNQPSRSQYFDQGPFLGGNAQSPGLHGIGTPYSLSNRLMSASSCFVGSGGTPATCSRGSSSRLSEVSFRLVTSIDPGFAQVSAYYGPTHTQAHAKRQLRFARQVSGGDSFAREGAPQPVLPWDIMGEQEPVEGGGAYSKLAQQLLLGRSCEVALDKVIGIRYFHFSGHVYDLQTQGQWYIANGIITHNCRCSMAPVTVTYKELGIPVEEPPEKTTTTQDWFLNQDEATQRTMLGNSKYEAWRGGKFELSDIPKRVHSDVWGDSFVEKSLEELLR